MDFDFDNLVVTVQKKEYEKIKPGLHNAICVGVWNVGVQKIKFKDEIKYKQQVVIGFEVEQRNSETKLPMFHPQVYNMSLHEKSNLSSVIESWMAKRLSKEERSRFDLTQLIGKKATLNIIYNEDYVNISSILPAQDSNQIKSEDVLQGEVPTRVKNLRAKAVINDSDPQINIDDVKPLKDLEKKPEAENTEKSPF